MTLMMLNEDEDDWIWQGREGAIKCARSIKGWEMPNYPPNTKHQIAIVVVIMLTVMMMTDEYGVYDRL